MRSLLTAVLCFWAFGAMSQNKAGETKELNAYGRDGKTVIAKLIANSTAKSNLFLIKTIQKEESANSYATTIYFGNKGTGALTDIRILLKFSKPVISVMPHFATAFKSTNGLSDDHNAYAFKAGRLERDPGSAVVIYFTIKSKDRIITEISGLDGILQ